MKYYWDCLPHQNGNENASRNNIEHNKKVLFCLLRITVWYGTLSAEWGLTQTTSLLIFFYDSFRPCFINFIFGIFFFPRSNKNVEHYSIQNFIRWIWGCMDLNVILLSFKIPEKKFRYIFIVNRKSGLFLYHIWINIDLKKCYWLEVTCMNRVFLSKQKKTIFHSLEIE